MKGEAVVRVAGQLGFLTEGQMEDLLQSLNPSMVGEELVAHLNSINLLDEGRGEILLRQMLLLERDASDAQQLVKEGKLSAMGAKQILDRQAELLPVEYVSLRSLLKERGIASTLEEDPEHLRDEADVRLVRFLLKRNALKPRDLMRAIEAQREHGFPFPLLSKVLVKLGLLQSNELEDATSRLSLSIAGPISLAGPVPAAGAAPAGGSSPGGGSHASVAELSPAQLKLLLGEEQEEEKLTSKLIQSAVINKAALEEAVQERKATGKNLTQILTERGLINPEQVHTAAKEVLKETSRPLGKYQLVRPLGEGGAGTVFLAYDTVLGRPVALKLLSKAVGPFADRFKQEAQVAARLDHPNIARIYEFGETDGMPYLALQYIDGTTADRAVKLDLRQRVAVIKTISQALHYAHMRGVVHRDLKPANIMVDSEGRPYLLDFGLARPVETGSGAPNRLTIEGAILGTPPFMAPEQARGAHNQVDAVSDVYGLAATLYFLLTGRPPIEKGTTLDTLRAVEEEEPVRPRRIDHKIPADLDNVIMKGLEKDKARRYPSAKDLADDLGRFLDGEAVTAIPPSTIYLLVKKFRKRRVAYSLTSLLVVAVIALAVIFVIYRRSEAQGVEARREAEWRRNLDEVQAQVEAVSLKMFEAGGIKPADRQLLQTANAACDQIVLSSSVASINAAAHSLSSRILQMLGNVEGAAKEVDKAIALSRDPRYIHQRALLQLAASGVKAGDESSSRVKQARQDLEEALQSGKLSPQQAVYAQIRLAEGSADLDEIAKLCERFATSAGSENTQVLAEALKLEGEIRLKRGDPKGALARLQEAARLKPGDAHLRYLLAYARHAVFGPEIRTSADPESVARPMIDDIDRSLEGDAEAAPAWNLKGRIHLDTADSLQRAGAPLGPHLEQALLAFQRATEKDASLADAWESLGDVCLLSADVHLAAGRDPIPVLRTGQKAYLEAVRLRPTPRTWANSAGTWLREARQLVRSAGDPTPALDLALQHTAEAIAIDPMHVSARFIRLEVNVILAGRQLAAGAEPAALIEEALQDLGVALTLMSDSIPVLRLGARANFLAARLEAKRKGSPLPALRETRRFLTLCLDADSSDLGVRADRVDVLLMLADYEAEPRPFLEDAEKDLTSILQVRATDTAPLAQRAGVRGRLGNVAGAVEDLDRRLADVPTDRDSLDARAGFLLRLAEAAGREGGDVLGLLRRADADLSELLKTGWDAKLGARRGGLRATIARLLFDAGVDAGESARAALEDLDRLLQGGATDIERLRERARLNGILAFLARRAGKDAEPWLVTALEDYDVAVRLRPDFIDLRDDRAAIELMLAESRDARGVDIDPLVARAREDLDAVLKARPSAGAWLNLGNLEVLRARKKLARSEDASEELKAASLALQQAATADPSLADAHGALAVTFIFRARFDLLEKRDPTPLVNEAVARLSRAIELAPNHPAYHRSRAVARLIQAEYEESQGRSPDDLMKTCMADFETALRLGRNDGQTVRDMGEAYAVQARLRSRKGEDPADVLRQAIASIERSGGSEADRLLARARIRQDVGRLRQESGLDASTELTEAIRDYSRAVELGVSESQVQQNLGLAHYLRAKHFHKVGKDAVPDLVQADAAFTKVSVALPGRATSWLNLALVNHLRAQILRTAGQGAEATKEFERAVAHYTKAVELDSKLAEAWGGRGLVNLALARKEEAKADLEKAIALDKALDPVYRPILKAFEKGKPK